MNWVLGCNSFIDIYIGCTNDLNNKVMLYIYLTLWIRSYLKKNQYSYLLIWCSTERVLNSIFYPQWQDSNDRIWIFQYLQFATNYQVIIFAVFLIFKSPKVSLMAKLVLLWARMALWLCMIHCSVRLKHSSWNFFVCSNSWFVYHNHITVLSLKDCLLTFYSLYHLYTVGYDFSSAFGDW